MNNKIVTVVVPVYNTENTLNRTVVSIIEQTYQNLDILLIDDGSTDSSSFLCDAWTAKDKRIRCIHKDNEGLGLTRNIGISNAMGKYILFIDSDDYIDSNMIYEMKEIADHYQADIVSTNFYFNDDPEHNLLKEGLYTEKNIKEVLLPRIFGRIKSAENDFFNVSACTKMYSKDFLNENNLRFKSEKKLIWEDMDFNCVCLAKAQKVHVLNKSYYHYCYNCDSLTHIYDSKKYVRIIHMYKHLCELINSFEAGDEAKKRLCFSVMGNIRMCIKQVVLFCTREEAMKEIRKIINDLDVKEIVKGLSIRNLSITQVLFNEAIKWRRINLVYILARLQNIKSKGIID